MLHFLLFETIGMRKKIYLNYDTIPDMSIVIETKIGQWGISTSQLMIKNSTEIEKRVIS